MNGGGDSWRRIAGNLPEQADLAGRGAGLVPGEKWIMIARMGFSRFVASVCAAFFFAGSLGCATQISVSPDPKVAAFASARMAQADDPLAQVARADVPRGGASRAYRPAEVIPVRLDWKYTEAGKSAKLDSWAAKNRFIRALNAHPVFEHDDKADAVLAVDYNLEPRPGYALRALRLGLTMGLWGIREPFTSTMKMTLTRPGGARVELREELVQELEAKPYLIGTFPKGVPAESAFQMVADYHVDLLARRLHVWPSATTGDAGGRF